MMALIPETWLKTANSTASITGKLYFFENSFSPEEELSSWPDVISAFNSDSAVAGVIGSNAALASCRAPRSPTSDLGLLGTVDTEPTNTAAGKASAPNIHLQEAGPTPRNG